MALAAVQGVNHREDEKDAEIALLRAKALPGVTERQNAGIHEDAFFVGRTMFMHIHGHGHCDIRLSSPDQERVLAESKARKHRWAPEKGYVTFVVKEEKDLEPAMDLIRLSHQDFACQAG